MLVFFVCVIFNDTLYFFMFDLIFHTKWVYDSFFFLNIFNFSLTFYVEDVE